MDVGRVRAILYDCDLNISLMSSQTRLVCPVNISNRIATDWLVLALKSYICSNNTAPASAPLSSSTVPPPVSNDASRSTQNLFEGGGSCPIMSFPKLAVRSFSSSPCSGGGEGAQIYVPCGMTSCLMVWLGRTDSREG